MNALICGSTRWTWSRHACRSSREETSRRASFGATSEMVSWFSMGSSRPHGLAAARAESGQRGLKRQSQIGGGLSEYRNEGYALLLGRVADGSGRVTGRVEPQKKPVNIGYGRPDGLKHPGGHIPSIARLDRSQWWC